MNNEAVSGAKPPLSNFARQLLQFLDRVEYRRIVHAEDLEEIGRLRYRSYRTRNVMDEAEVASIVDDIDRDSHAFVYGVYVDGLLVSTLRIHYVTPEHRKGTSYVLFQDILDPLLNNGMCFVDPTRFAADPDLLSEFPAIPYITLRIASMASEYFTADQCLASVKPEHMAFYKRIFGTTVIAEAREHSGYGIKVGLGAAPISKIRDAVAVRFPFFKSMLHERRAMFADLQSGAVPLTILPTAKYTGLGI